MVKTENQEQHGNKNNDGVEQRNNPAHVPYILNGELYRIESQNGDHVTVKCCFCPPDRIYRGSVRSTGNFHMHIKRRHASLLGKLHEMKVAALVERRDRIMKNRQMAKSRKKSSTPVMPPAAVVAAELSKSEFETQELKIKTVFQRHKQEQHQQEEEAEAVAIRTSISMCESSMDNSQSSDKQLSTIASPDDNNINNIFNTNEPNAGNCIAKESSPSMANNNDDIILSSLLSINIIKPEQAQQHQQLELRDPESRPIDLSRSSSLPSDDMDSGVDSTGGVNVQVQMSTPQELTNYVNGSPHKLLMHINATLGNIKDELLTRNHIENKRLLFEMAKFNYLHPNFKFDNNNCPINN